MMLITIGNECSHIKTKEVCIFFFFFVKWERIKNKLRKVVSYYPYDKYNIETDMHGQVAGRN